MTGATDLVSLQRQASDVRRARERRKRRRALTLLVVEFVLLVLLLWQVFGGGLGIHLPHPTGEWAQVAPATIIVLLLGTVMVGPLLANGRSPHVLYRPEEIPVGIGDLRGIGNIRADIERSLQLFLLNRTFADHMGGVPRRGILLEGPPGTGKTLTAKAIAKGAGVPFLFVSSSAFQSMFYGQTNRRIRAYFRALRRYARNEGGAIGFIEELDAIGASRAGLLRGRGEGVAGVVNELLIQMQSFDEPTALRRLSGAVIELANRFLPEALELHKRPVVAPNVMVFGATNRASDLDPALVRPGRFDRALHFGLPGREARADIIGYYLDRMAHSNELDEPRARAHLSAMTTGYSPAALQGLLNEALVVAVSRHRAAMTMEDINTAKLETELGLTDPVTYTDEERRRVAYHEAGHATVAWKMGGTRRLDVLSIVKRREALGLLAHSPSEERFSHSRTELYGMIRIAMGGMAAEEAVFGEAGSGPEGDLQVATEIGARMVGALGMGGSLVSLGASRSSGEDMVARVLGDDRARKALDTLLDQAHSEAREVVSAERRVLTALAEALLARGELVGDEIVEVADAAAASSPSRVDGGLPVHAAYRAPPS